MADLLSGDVGEWVVTAADVFYDPDNLPLLEILLGRFAQVWVSDSRLTSQSLPGMEIVGTYDSHTVPDLDKSHDFNSVTVFSSGSPMGSSITLVASTNEPAAGAEKAPFSTTGEPALPAQPAD